MNAQFAGARPASAGALDFLIEDSDAARILRATDWASTSIGDPSTWSPTLRVLTRFVLAQRFPMLLWWGPDYVQIYNDAYSPILGAKHPSAMGQPLRECWYEIWDVLKPLVDTPYNGGPATWMEDIELAVKRRGFLEESHFTIAYSPVHDEAAPPRGMGGVLATVHEITEKVIGQRRVALLRELGAGVSETRTDHDACRAAADILAKYPKDIPFALLYLIDASGGEPRFVCGTGIPPEGFDAVVGGNWPLAEALRAEQPQVVDDLARLVKIVPSGPYPEPPISAVVVPIKSNVANRPAGVLVAGVSSRIRLDSEYSGFYELVGAQLATAVANARAYDEERRRALALAELDRAKITFFSNISHEFRTPLTLMLGPLEQALADASLPPALREQIDLAQRNSQRLLKLVNSLLNFARIESGRVRASFEPVDLGGITVDLASNFRSAMERAGLQFDVRTAEFNAPVYVDQDMWEKIVLNLISNAFKFTLQGRVCVTLTADNGHAVLEVADTGVGVPEHEVPRLFDRFHRVEGTQGRTHEGSGIGLTLVQELVRLHGGTIDVESTLGEGSRFRVRLPFGNAHLPPESIRAANTQTSAATSAQAYVQEALRWLPTEQGKANKLLDVATRDQRFASTYGARIVLADDNSDMRQYLQTLLGANYEVEAVADGAQALAAIRRKRPDLVLSDVMMPLVDGFELIQALRADDALHDVAVILLSARAGEESRIEGLNAGADDFIVKPFIARELLTRIGALLELRRLRKDVDSRFQAFVEATSDVVYRMNPDWTEMRELQGRNFIADTAAPSRGWLQKYIHPDDQGQLMAAINESVHRKSVFQLEHRVIRRDGTEGWVSSRAIPMIDESGAVTEWIGAASDITARRLDREALLRQQSELEAADQQKNEFLAMLAHELRNPLAPIRNSGEVLARSLARDPIALGAVHMIERQVTHLTRLVDDLLDVSRITQGRIELRRQDASIAELVSRALETVAPLAQRKQQRVIARSASPSMTVNVDPERIVQCLANVLTNANKFTELDGEIRVETGEEGGYARISVIDNGVGIARELLPRVFDLFVQGKRTLDRSQGGLGIGLSIVKRLVEMHGGDVAIDSAGEGRGTRVTIRLPLTETAGVTAGSTAVPKGKPRRILVVDDNEDAANSLAMVLAIDGHETATAFNGLQALERTSTFRPDVVLLDIGLPGIDGYEVAHRIRASSAGRPMRLVALTGYGQEEDREKARMAGFADHLVKPVEYATLQRAIADPAATSHH